MSNNISDQVDVRGPRFAAWVTTAVLIATLLLSAVSTTTAAALLAAQTAVFAIGAAAGPRRHPYGRIFATFVAPRLGPVAEREPVKAFLQLSGSEGLPLVLVDGGFGYGQVIGKEAMEIGAGGSDIRHGR